jgi:type I restriction enzyme M protein
VVASWWGEAQFDLKSLVALGFEGSLDGWVMTIVTAIEEDGGKFQALDHKLVKHLLPEYLDEVTEAEGAAAELDERLKATEPMDVEDESGDEFEQILPDAEIRALKKERTQARKKLKSLKTALATRLQDKRSSMADAEARQVVLELLESDLKAELDRVVRVHRQLVESGFESLWDKYHAALRVIEEERDETDVQLSGFLKTLGYD